MRHRFQFGLRALLIVVLTGAALLSWFVQRRDAAAKQSAVSRVLSKGGMIGSDRNQTVTEVIFAGQRGDVDLAATVTDDDLDNLSAFPGLQKLDLSGRPITDAAIPSISRLTRLRVLNVRDTRITDDGILRLRAALPSCVIER
jgi:hypothetical protein